MLHKNSGPFSIESLLKMLDKNELKKLEDNGAPKKRDSIGRVETPAEKKARLDRAIEALEKRKEFFNPHFEALFKKDYPSAKTENVTDWHAEYFKYWLADLRRKDFLHLTFEDLHTKKYKDGLTYLSWAKKNNDQALLNHCYRIILNEHQKHPVDTIIYRRPILHWAILCHQPPKEIDYLVRQEGASLTLRAGRRKLNALELAHFEKQNETLNFLNEFGNEFKFSEEKRDATPKIKNHKDNAEVIDSLRQTPAKIALDNPSHSYRSKLLAYIEKTNQRADNHLHHQYSFFRWNINLSLWRTEAKIKKAGANALYNVVFKGGDVRQLDAHKAAFANGELKTIYNGLKPLYFPDNFSKAPPLEGEYGLLSRILTRGR